MAKLKHIFTAVGVGLIAYSGYKWYKIQSEAIEKLDFSVVGVEWEEKSLSRARAEVTMSVINNADVNFMLTSYDLNVKMFNKQITRVINDGIEQDILCCGQETIIKFVIDFVPTQLLSDAWNIAKMIVQNASIEMNVSGTASVKAMGGLISVANVPIDYDFNSYNG